MIDYFNTEIMPLTEQLDKVLNERKKVKVTYVPSTHKFVKIPGFNRLFWKPF